MLRGITDCGNQKAAKVVDCEPRMIDRRPPNMGEVVRFLIGSLR
jgi:hypothetical protein